MNDSSRPRFASCEDTVGARHHELASAWGVTWCECRHAFVVEQHDPGHDGIDADSLPVWWNRALREAIDANPDAGFDLAIAWAHLRILARDLASDGEHERWDEFAPRVLELDEARAEQFLRLLATAGIASVIPSAWDYRDGKDYWHSGDQCGCTLLAVRLNAEESSLSQAGA
jgi:hypothetical protein